LRSGFGIRVGAVTRTRADCGDVDPAQVGHDQPHTIVGIAPLRLAAYKGATLSPIRRARSSVALAVGGGD